MPLYLSPNFEQNSSEISLNDEKALTGPNGEMSVKKRRGITITNVKAEKAQLRRFICI